MIHLLKKMMQVRLQAAYPRRSCANVRSVRGRDWPLIKGTRGTSLYLSLFLGIFAPDLRAWFNAIATACLRDLPCFVSVLIFRETVSLDVPLFSGMVVIPPFKYSIGRQPNTYPSAAYDASTERAALYAHTWRKGLPQ
jgi:hypothetical protein